MNIFNFVRVVATICVFCLHFVITVKNTLGYTDASLPWLLYTPAWAAMWMFFLLSGYLLGKGFVEGKYETTRKGICVFYLSRFLRIAPLYFLFLLIIFLFVNPSWFYSIGMADNIRFLTFMYNGIPGIVGIGATWFVSVIMQLYLIAPFLYKYVISRLYTSKQCFIGLITVIIIGAINRWILQYNHVDWYKYVYTFSLSNIDIFFSGMLLSKLIIQDKKDCSIKKYCRPIFMSVFIGFILFNTYCFYNKLYIDVYQYFFPSVYIVILCFLFYSFDIRKDIVTKTGFVSRIINTFSSVSYAFFLFHSNILEVIPNIMKANNLKYENDLWIVFILSFVLVFIFSMLINVFFEEKSEFYRKNILTKYM